MSARGARSIAPACLAILLTRLSAAPPAAAQAPPVAASDPVPARVEVGGSAGVLWHVPTAGILASVPVARRLALEGTASVLPDNVMGQAQIRVPFRLRWRSRRSFVAGFTHVAGPGAQKGPGVHVGVSFQGMVYRHLDARADLQQVAHFDDGPDASPRAVLTFVWHP